MSKSLPYINNLEIYNGAFITPSNAIILVKDRHDITAKKYCEGENEQSSQLSIKEQELYEYWKNYNKWRKNNRETDFLITVLGFDKIENIVKHSIMTSSLEPYIRFYNYLLMDWTINLQTRVIYNPDKKTFERQSLSSWHIGSLEEQEAREEIEDIKKRVKKIDRPLFFKS